MKDIKDKLKRRYLVGFYVFAGERQKYRFGPETLVARSFVVPEGCSWWRTRMHI
jgi:hypothetical protein